MAQIYFGASGKEVGANSPVFIGVFLNSDRQSLNAFEGDIVVSGDLTEISSVNEGDSIVSLWIEHPTLGADGHTIHFSGITPGGYTGDQGPLFTFVAQTADQGSVQFSTKNEQLLLNDGLGTAATIRQAPMTVSITKTIPVAVPPVAEDHIAPESFTPVFSADPNLFSGRTFVSFQTRDLLSGVDHYQLREVPPWYSLARLIGKHEWSTIQSPAVLSDQTLRSFVSLKAVDRSGNEYVTTSSPAHQIPVYENGILILSFGLAAIIILFLWRKKRQR